MSEKKIFKLSEVTKILEINRHFVIHLVEKKVIRPLQDVKGRGKVRKYSYANVLQIGLFLRLTKFDISYGTAAGVLSIVNNMLKRGSFEGLMYVVLIALITKNVAGIKYVPEDPYEMNGDNVISGPMMVNLVKDDKGVLSLFFDGDRKVLPLGVYGMPGELIPPEKALSQATEIIIKSNSNIKKEDFSCYFILDVQNIKRHIDFKIHNL